MLKIKVKTHKNNQGQIYYHMDSLYKDPQSFRQVIHGVVDHYRSQNLNGIMAIEGRGFILGSMMAYLLGLPFIPARKAGKLPAAKIFQDTNLGMMEVHQDSVGPGERILIVDAILNIEHSFEGAALLIEKMGGVVAGVLCLSAMDDLALMAKTISDRYPIHVLFSQVIDEQKFAEPSLDLASEESVHVFTSLIGGEQIQKILLEQNYLGQLKACIRTIPHFPKEGIQFRDITTIMQKPEMFRTCIQEFIARYGNGKLQAICGIESRGFIFGAPLAYALGIPFIPVSKKGKIPGETLSVEYEIEYGLDEIEMDKYALQMNDRILVVDDLIATGGTALGACELAQQCGAIVEEVACIIELPDLLGRSKLNNQLFTLVEFAGE